MVPLPQKLKGDFFQSRTRGWILISLPIWVVGFPQFFLSVPLLVFIAHAFFSFVDISASHTQQRLDTTFSDRFFIFPVVCGRKLSLKVKTRYLKMSLESVSVNMIPTVKQDLRDIGPPQQVFHVYFTTLFFYYRCGNIIFLNALSPVYNLSSYLYVMEDANACYAFIPGC